ncbi:unnamed protein product [Spirodela intermedia]|uniref:Uncharacterized protein n=2 Tax=Spirodela intermedia TaxID=51605 RepID=A0A7I8KK15_SPIIN|nr:unnamed protein product [Spirodela intermedia]CAA6661078.1 unnamed protein product [Spirodela intermedia]CAA7397438.1 unnamed protein product [Spirodela intermedia]
MVWAPESATRSSWLSPFLAKRPMSSSMVELERGRLNFTQAAWETLLSLLPFFTA